MGASGKRFTLDEGLSQAVRKSFGLIYRKIFSTWESGNQTALSDLEVDFLEIEGELTQIRYPLKKNKGQMKQFIEIATTRPETCWEILLL